MKTGVVYSPIYLEHDTGQHPENASRLKAIVRHLRDTGTWQKLVPVAPRAATVEELSLVHDMEHIGRVRGVVEKGGGWLDADTVVSADSYEAALYAAGGAIEATRAVIAGDVDNAFALVRPPGHHATPRRAMGFCLFNNVAIAARHALKNCGLERLAIIDFDVHHGNGTQDAFYNESKVLYISTHQFPHYPGTGDVDEVGNGEAGGTTVNIPLPAGCGDGEYRLVFKEIIAPVVKRFKPQLILVSAGYDGHWIDPLASMRLTTSGFAEVVSTVRGLAGELCSGHLLLCLEGGYNLEALSSSVEATFNVLLGRSSIVDSLGPPRRATEPPGIDSLIVLLQKRHHLA